MIPGNANVIMTLDDKEANEWIQALRHEGLPRCWQGLKH